MLLSFRKEGKGQIWGAQWKTGACHNTIKANFRKNNFLGRLAVTKGQKSIYIYMVCTHFPLSLWYLQDPWSKFQSPHGQSQANVAYRCSKIPVLHPHCVRSDNRGTETHQQGRSNGRCDGWKFSRRKTILFHAARVTVVRGVQQDIRKVTRPESHSVIFTPEIKRLLNNKAPSFSLGR